MELALHSSSSVWFKVCMSADMPKFYIILLFTLFWFVFMMYDTQLILKRTSFFYLCAALV